MNSSMRTNNNKRTINSMMDESEVEEYDTSFVRAGKWSPEEETYACRLIRDFEQGSLVDCEEGSTLRSYLARKLNCAPMRISKKFAGKCIGKHAFTKNPSAQSSPMPSSWLTPKPKPAVQRVKRVRRVTRPHSPSSDDDSLSDLSSGESESWSNGHGKDRSQYYLPPSASFIDLATIPVYDQFVSLEDDCASIASSSADVENAEWRDVLDYFCGLPWDDMDSQPASQPEGIPRTISYASLFRE